MIHRFIPLSKLFAVLFITIAFPSWAQLIGNLPVGGSPVTLSFSPTFIDRGQSTRMTWSVSDPSISSCRFLDVPGVRDVAPNGSLLLSPTENLRALIICDSDFNKTAEASVVVSEPNEPPGINASFNPSTVIVGRTSRFGWNAPRARNCSSIGDVDVDNTFGVEFVTPTTVDDLSVTIICNGDGGTNTRTTTLNVVPVPPSVRVYANPNRIESPRNVFYEWRSENTTFCNRFIIFDDDASSIRRGELVGVNGNEWRRTEKSLEYQITCQGPGGTITDFARVVVEKPDGGSQGGVDISKAQLSTEDLPLSKEVGQSIKESLAVLGIKKDETFSQTQGDFNLDGFLDILLLDNVQQILYVLISKEGQLNQISKKVGGVNSLSQIKGLTIDVQGNIRVNISTEL